MTLALDGDRTLLKRTVATELAPLRELRPATASRTQRSLVAALAVTVGSALLIAAGASGMGFTTAHPGASVLILLLGVAGLLALAPTVALVSGHDLPLFAAARALTLASLTPILATLLLFPLPGIRLLAGCVVVLLGTLIVGALPAVPAVHWLQRTGAVAVAAVLAGALGSVLSTLLSTVTAMAALTALLLAHEQLRRVVAPAEPAHQD